MTDFRDQDLTGASFEHVRLRDATMTRVDLTGLQVSRSMLHGCRLLDVELVDVEIRGDLRNVVVNGVDVVPLVEAELDRRMPGRALMRARDVDGLREAWALLERLWDETLARARALPEEALHESVEGEWSFIQTLRHLAFATDAWVARAVTGDDDPWHPLDLPWDQAPGWPGVPWDRDARPSLEEAVALRRSRQDKVAAVVAGLTDERLAAPVTCTGDSWPQVEDWTVLDCLHVALNQEWEHRLYAERDLAALEQRG
ncbi:MAG: DinB family protein [Nocardioides sp.]